MRRTIELRRKKFPVINVKMLFLDTMELTLVYQPSLYIGLTLLEGYFTNVSIKYLTYIFNIVTGICYIFGGWIADSYLGKFIVFFVSVFIHTVCAISLLITVLMGTPYLNVENKNVMLLFGYLLYSVTRIGYGCRSPLLSEQFDMPQEKENLTVYYTYQFWLFNLSKCVCHVLISYVFFNPVICSKTTCYAIIYTLAILVNNIYLGVIIYYRRLFKPVVIKRKAVEHSFIVLYHAALAKLFYKHSSKNSIKKNAFDLIENEENREYVANTKTALDALSVVCPCIGFYAGREYLINLWQVLAKKMDVDLILFSIDTAEIRIIKNIITLILIPASVKLISPLLHKFGLIFTSITNVAMSFLLIVACLLLSTYCQFQFKNSKWKPLKNDEISFTFFNGLTNNCVIMSNKNIINNIIINSFDMKDLRIKYEGNSPITEIIIKCNNEEWKDFNADKGGEAFSYLIAAKRNNKFKVFKHTITEYYQENFQPRLLFYCGIFPKCPLGEIELIYLKTNAVVMATTPKPSDISIIDIQTVGFYKLNVAGEYVPTGRFITGATYTFLITKSKTGKMVVNRFELVHPYSVHIGWLIPQFILASIADILAYVNIDVFVYTQSPVPLRAFISTIAECIQIIGEGLLKLFINEDKAHNMIYQYHIAIVILSCLFIFIYTRAKYKFRTIYEEDY